MAANYHEQPIRLDGRERWLIHFRNDRDGVVLEGGRVALFDGAEALREYARKKKLKLRESRPLLDFDLLLGWLSAPDTPPDCRSLYAAWNLLGDLATALGRHADYPGYDPRLGYLQEELLWGCNLPSAWDMEEAYVPAFSALEAQLMSAVLEAGLDMLRASAIPA